MKILDLNIARLLKPDAKEYFCTFKTEAEKCPSIPEKMTGWWEAFLAAYAKFEKASVTSLKSDYTEEIHLTCARRYTMFVSFKAAIDSMRRSMNEETMRIATSIYNSINSFKVKGHANYIAQTGQFDTILAVLTTQQADNVSALKLTVLVDEMVALNEQMHALIGDRDAENASKPEGMFETARKELEDRYRELVVFINAWYLVMVEQLHQDDPALTRFIEVINEVILRFKKVSLKAPNGSGTEEEEVTEETEETDEEETPGTGNEKPTPDEDENGTNPNPNPNPNPGNGEEGEEGGEENTEGEGGSNNNPNLPPPPTGGGESGFDW